MMFVKWDWKSIEPLVHDLLAQCEEWIAIFWNARRDPEDLRADVYRMIYGPVIGVRPEAVTKAQRDQAKVFLLAMLYDRHFTTVAAVLGMPVEDAKKLCDRFWDAYPAIAERANRAKIAFLRGQHIRNPFGQRVFYANRANGGVYDPDLIEIIETEYIYKPMYEWAEDPTIKQFVHADDIADCRKVGNWQIQSPGGS